MSSLPYIVGGLAVGLVAVALLKKKRTSETGGSVCDALCVASGVPLDACKQGAMYKLCTATAGAQVSTPDVPAWQIGMGPLACLIPGVGCNDSHECKRGDVSGCKAWDQGLCPEGQTMITNHRSDAPNAVQCSGDLLGAGGKVVAPDLVGKGTQTTLACVNGQPPAGYTYDGGILRRLRVSESPNPCPGGATSSADGSTLAATLAARRAAKIGMQ